MRSAAPPATSGNGHHRSAARCTSPSSPASPSSARASPPASPRLIALALAGPAMEAWGWRIPFLLALPLGALCLYMRLQVEDSPEFVAAKAKGETDKKPVKDLFKNYRRTGAEGHPDRHRADHRHLRRHRLHLRVLLQRPRVLQGRRVHRRAARRAARRCRSSRSSGCWATGSAANGSWSSPSPPTCCSPCPRSC